MKILVIGVISLLLYACGAAKNPNSREGKDPTVGGKKPTNREILAAESEKMQASLSSQIFRNRESQQLNHVGLRQKLAKNELPKTHRLIPDIEQDISETVIKPTKLLSPSADCGNQASEETSIIQRQKDCERIQEDQNSVFWLGKNKAINGEGAWQLIANSVNKDSDGNMINNKILWQDLRTGLIWSDVIHGLNWEEAVGVDSYLSSRPCQAKLDNPKHELGRINPKLISWRVPNRNEFLQADINGSRYVLPNTQQDLVWTSSYAGDNKAWAIKVSTGELVKKSIDDTLSVRCIGVILK